MVVKVEWCIKNTALMLFYILSHVAIPLASHIGTVLTNIYPHSYHIHITSTLPAKDQRGILGGFNYFYCADGVTRLSMDATQNPYLECGCTPGCPCDINVDETEAKLQVSPGPSLVQV